MKEKDEIILKSKIENVKIIKQQKEKETKKMLTKKKIECNQLHTSANLIVMSRQQMSIVSVKGKTQL